MVPATSLLEGDFLPNHGRIVHASTTPECIISVLLVGLDGHAKRASFWPYEQVEVV